MCSGWSSGIPSRPGWPATTWRSAGRDAKIAILHDGTVYGQGLAEATKGQLNRHGVKETRFDQIAPGQPEYTETVAALEAAGIKVLFYGGHPAEAALIARQVHERGYDLQLVGSDNLNSEYFLRVAGPAVEGVRFVALGRRAYPRGGRAGRRQVPRGGIRARGLDAVRVRRHSGLGAGGREGGHLRCCCRCGGVAPQ